MQAALRPAWGERGKKRERTHGDGAIAGACASVRECARLPSITSRPAARPHIATANRAASGIRMFAGYSGIKQSAQLIDSEMKGNKERSP